MIVKMDLQLTYLLLSLRFRTEKHFVAVAINKSPRDGTYLDSIYLGACPPWKGPQLHSSHYLHR